MCDQNYTALLKYNMIGTTKTELCVVAFDYKTSPQTVVTYSINHKVSKGLWYLGNWHCLHVKDWIKDIFTAHSLLLRNKC